MVREKIPRRGQVGRLLPEPIHDTAYGEGERKPQDRLG
jgi:hypothetical protein